MRSGGLPDFELAAGYSLDPINPHFGAAPVESDPPSHLRRLVGLHRWQYVATLPRDVSGAAHGLD